MPCRILRIDHTESFTIVSNMPLRNPALSMKARGLLMTCLSCSETFSLSLKALETILPDRHDAIHSAFKELQDAGYAHFYKIKTPATGKIVESITAVSEIPLNWPADFSCLQSGNPIMDYAQCEPQSGNPIMDYVQCEPQSEKPIMDCEQYEPQSENPQSGNRTHRNNNIRNNNIYSRLLLFFHSKGYASFRDITDDFVDRCEALGWKNSSGAPIIDKFAYARAWTVRDEFGKPSIFADDAAKKVWAELISNVNNNSDVLTLTSVTYVEIVNDELRIKTSSKQTKEALTKYKHKIEFKIRVYD